jgi:ABC-type dipeptide/oligopeptide/nickel transport system permease component
MSLIADRLPATIKLTIAGILVSGLFGVAFGIAAGVRPGSLFDRASSTFALACVSFPYFWFGILLIIVFAVKLKAVPVLVDDREWKSYILPAVTLGMHHGGRLFQLSRSATFDELSKSYITVATAKGLSHWAVIVRHILRNIGIVVATMVGWEYARMWGGTVFLVEFVFAWPGIGKLVTDAANRHDFHVIEAGVVVAGLFVVFANLVVDSIYGLIDKRMEVS